MPDSAGRQPVKIVTDGGADLPLEWVKRWDIGVVPAFVNFGQESYADDGVSITKAEFYRKLAEARTLPTTSAPPAGLVEQIVATQLAKAEHVVLFTVAKQFSSMYNSLRVGAAHVDADRTTVIDTGSVSMAEGWMTLAGAEAAARGASLQEVLAIAQSVRERTRLYAVIDTLEYLRRSGRVSWAQANFGAFLQIKPMLEVIDGVPQTVARVRTMGKAEEMLVELARKQAPFERIALLHSNFLEGALKMKEKLADLLPTEPIDNFLISDVTTAIGTHIGPNCLGVITVHKA